MPKEQMLQPRAGSDAAKIVQEVVEGVGTSLLSTKSSDRHNAAPLWHDFVHNADFLPEVKRTDKLRQAIETVRPRVHESKLTGRVDVTKLSPEDQKAYKRAKMLLLYYIHAAAESKDRTQAVLRDWTQAVSVPDRAQKLRPSTVSKLKQLIEAGDFDQRHLTYMERKELDATAISHGSVPGKAAKLAPNSSPGGASSSISAKHSGKASAAATEAVDLTTLAPTILPVARQHSLTITSAQPAAPEIASSPRSEVHTVFAPSVAPPSHFSSPPSEPSLMPPTPANPGLPPTSPANSPQPYQWLSLDGPIRSPDGLYPY